MNLERLTALFGKPARLEHEEEFTPAASGVQWLPVAVTPFVILAAEEVRKAVVRRGDHATASR